MAGQRGGRRPGAGRKPTKGPTVRYALDVSHRHAELLRAWGGGDMSAGLRWLIDAAAPLVGEGTVTLTGKHPSKENQSPPAPPSTRAP